VAASFGAETIDNGLLTLVASWQILGRKMASVIRRVAVATRALEQADVLIA
jgi:hypothetical protein